MSSGNTRILGQFLLAGFSNNCYSAVDGGRTTPNDYKDMTAELDRMLGLATPKVIVWALGMNDSYAHNHDAIEQVMSTCALKGITLILYKTPSTPSYDRSELNAYVVSTGLRYVDAFEAVGVHGADNEWYEGFLDTSETPYAHPTALGAAAIAARYLIDVPELTQYGYTSS